jgi:hypothetical protein
MPADFAGAIYGVIEADGASCLLALRMTRACGAESNLSEAARKFADEWHRLSARSGAQDTVARDIAALAFARRWVEVKGTRRHLALRAIGMHL